MNTTQILMARSHCTGPRPEAGPGMGLEAMGYYIICITVHTALGLKMGLDPLSPIVPVLFPVPVPFSFLCSVNVP